MSRKTRRSLTKLSFKEASAACRELLPIGESLFHYMDSLQNANYSAFLPHHRFEQSFCISRDDLEIHRRCIIEGAKQTLGRPWPLSLRIRPEDRQYLFTSSFIEELCKRRDIANGVPVAQLASSYPGEIWRTEIDPCRRRIAHARVENRTSFDEQWRIVREEQRRRLDDEALLHSDGISGGYERGLQHRQIFFKEVMDRNVTLLGFEYDKIKSCSFSSIYTKALSEDWELCFAVEDERGFWFSQTEGNFEINLEVRNKRLVGSIEEAEPGTFLIIRFQHIIPGFLGAYRNFVNLNQLEAIVKAHVFLYNLMRESIEFGLLRHL